MNHLMHWLVRGAAVGALGLSACGSSDGSPPGVDAGSTRDSSAPPPVDAGPPPVYASMTEAAAALTPGSWYQLPATNKLADVFPVAGPGDNWNLRGTPSAVVYAWGGGAVAQGKLFVWGGGHNDYGGNEVYTFDLGTWTWTRVTDPSNYVAYPCGYAEPVGPCVTVDDTPVSAHSYEGINFIPALGQFWVGGGAVYSTAGGFGAQSAVFNLATTSWTMLPDMPFAGSVISAWDPVSQKMLIILGSGSSPGGEFFSYDPASDAYENVSSPNWSVSSSGDFDFDTRQFVLYDRSRPDDVYVYDLSGIDLSPDVAVPWSRFDYRPTFMDGSPFAPTLKDATGMVYMPTRRLYVLWDGASSDVWTLDPATWSWQQITALNSGPTPSAQSQGPYGRWRYLPEYGVFLAYDNIDENPWIYKLP